MHACRKPVLRRGCTISNKIAKAARRVGQILSPTRLCSDGVLRLIRKHADLSGGREEVSGGSKGAVLRHLAICRAHIIRS